MYGAGTMAGAIRYIPKRPEFDATDLKLRGSTYGYTDDSSLGGDGGATLNLPISDTLAFRGSYDYRSDPGFIDYVYLVRDIGVSNPDPDFSATGPMLRRISSNTKVPMMCRPDRAAPRCDGRRPTRSTRR